MSEVSFSTASVWLPLLRRRSGAAVRLFCFPYAGGAASAYASWPDLLPESIDVRPVQLPGRWNRMRERPFTCVEDVVAALGRVLPATLDRPFAFFGHSMGALLAFETARYLRRHGLPLPSHLFVSGCRAPHMVMDDLPRPGLPDSEFMDEIRRLNGTPEEILQSAELMQMLLPTLRADMEVCRTYVHAPLPPLSCPITLFCGIDDKESRPPYAEGWTAHSTAGCSVHMFPGDHFFVRAQTIPILEIVRRTLHDITATLALAREA
jgi:medium-chain acyl-[acyl-carrier-protein] hydrolase